MTIEAQNLGVRRGNRALLDDVHARLEPGRLTAVIGPNGAGKSTFLNCLTGSLKPDQGQVTYDGIPIAAISAEELALRRAVLGQSLSTPGAMALEDLVSLGRMPHRRHSNGRYDRSVVAAAMEQTGIEHLVGRTCGTLSGGELQRGHIARTIAQVWKDGSAQPRFLFLDEPTTSLDPAFQMLILRQARQLTDQGYGVVAVLHDLNHAAWIADHMILLDQGHIAASGMPFEVLTEDWIETVYGISTVTVPHPTTGKPTILFAEELSAPPREKDRAYA